MTVGGRSLELLHVGGCGWPWKHMRKEVGKCIVLCHESLAHEKKKESHLSTCLEENETHAGDMGCGWEVCPRTGAGLEAWVCVAGAKGDGHSKKKGDHTSKWAWSVCWVMGLALLGPIWA